MSDREVLDSIPQEIPREVAEDGDSIEVYYATSARFLDVQLSSIDSLDTKANTTLGVGSAILPLSLGILRTLGDNPSPWVLSLVSLAISCYVVLAVCWGISTRGSKEVDYRPDIPTMRVNLDSGDYTADVLKMWVATEREVSIQQNDELMRHKSRYVGFAQYAFVGESVSLAIAGGLSLILA